MVIRPSHFVGVDDGFLLMEAPCRLRHWLLRRLSAMQRWSSTLTIARVHSLLRIFVRKTGDAWGRKGNEVDAACACPNPQL